MKDRFTLPEVAKAFGLGPDLKPIGEWYDVTVVGSSYQEQLHTSGKRRHRPLNLNVDKLPFDAELGVGEWLDGPAPK